MENNNQQLKEELSKEIKDTNRKIEESNENLKQQIIGEMVEINQKMEQYNETIKQQISDTNEQLKQTSLELQQFKEDVCIQIDHIENNNIIRMESVQKETQEKIRCMKR